MWRQTLFLKKKSVCSHYDVSARSSEQINVGKIVFIHRFSCYQLQGTVNSLKTDGGTRPKHVARNILSTSFMCITLTFTVIKADRVNLKYKGLSSSWPDFWTQ